jgi:uncharacterized membrane protein YkoI
MKPFLIIFTTAFICLFVVTSSLSAAEQSKVVKLGHLPKPVQAAIRKHTADGKLGPIDKITEDGEVSYDVEVTQGDKTRTFTIGPKGELLSMEVFPDELPAAVQKAIGKIKGTLGEINKVTEDGETSYDVEITVVGKIRNFTFSEDGQSVSLEISLEETPAAVKKAIESQTVDGKLNSIEKVTDDGEVSYEVEIIQAGKLHNLTFSADGQSVSLEIALEETPAAVKKAIESQTADGKLNSIEKVTDDGEVFYDVEVIKNQETRSLSFDANGALISEEADVK